jgi:hypothetical protein
MIRVQETINNKETRLLIHEETDISELNVIVSTYGEDIDEFNIQYDHEKNEFSINRIKLSDTMLILISKFLNQ